MIFISDIIKYINEIAPYELQEDWDNSGFLIGDRYSRVTKIGCCLDLCEETLEQAAKNGVNLIVTHHPVIFKAKKNLFSDDVVFKAVKNGMNVISAHTCYDAAEGGVNDVLCSLIGLEDVQAIDNGGKSKIMRFGKVKATDVRLFAKEVAQALETTVRLSTAVGYVEKVAVCGGAGGDLWEYAAAAGAQMLVTGEASHHEMLNAKACNLSIIAAGHFETENPSVYKLKKRLAMAFPEIETLVLKQSNPVEYIKNGT